MEPDYTLEELSPEEMQNLSTEMSAILEKYGCEMAVRSNIEIMKRVPITKDGENIQDTQEETTEVHETVSSTEA